MLTSKRTVIAAVIVLFTVSFAIAASAHFISCSKSQQGNNLTVSFKEAGLGNETTCITVRATATAMFACFNGGGNNPSAANKRTISEQRVATDCFSPRNGQITGSLTLTPPGPGDFTCPPGQRLRLVGSVTYTNVQVVDTTHGVNCTP